MRCRAAFLSFVVLLAACGGGGSSELVPAPGSANTGSAKSVTVAITYTVIDLGANVNPYAINGSNEVVGGAFFNGATNAEEAFLYANGAMHNLGTLPGATGSYASGINDAGTIIGTSFGPGSNQSAVLFSATAAPFSLGTGNGAASQGNAVNNNGELVGTVFSATDGSSGSCYNQIAIFDGHGGAQQYEKNALAVAVNASGTIVFDIYNGITLDCREGTISIGLYPSNTTVPYPSNESNDYGNGGATGINDEGDVVGYYRDSNFNSAGFYYHNGTSIELLPAGYGGEGTGFYALGINNLDVIVGRGGSNAHGFAWYNGTFTDLNSRLAANCTQYTITSAQAINDNGYILATAFFNGAEHGVILVPQP